MLLSAAAASPNRSAGGTGGNRAILSLGGIAVTALDLTAPLAVVSLALLLLFWGGYVVPGSYVPRFVAAATLDAGHGVTVHCRRTGC